MINRKVIYLAAFSIIGLISNLSCNKGEDCVEQTWYQDADGDGFGNPNNFLLTCEQPNGFVANSTDFDDSNSSAFPNATYYKDNDGDLYGNPNDSIVADNFAPSGYVTDNTDCDDSDDSINPGTIENITDGIDNNCDGYIDILVYVDLRDDREYIYKKIGNNYWMTENLKFTPSEGNYHSFNNPRTGTLHYLYDWETAFMSCPNGWHIPTDNEWKQLEMTLGMSESEANSNDWRGDNEGGKLKSLSVEWDDPNTGASDEFGMSILPCGFVSNGSHVNINKAGYYTTISVDDDLVWTRRFWYNRSDIGRYRHSKKDMMSVRCIKNN